MPHACAVPAAAALLAIGDVAKRAGVSVPTLRYYEQLRLISSTRSVGNQRRYPRHVLRRLAFISAAQRVGLSLEQIATALATLPARNLSRWMGPVGVSG